MFSGGGCVIFRWCLSLCDIYFDIHSDDLSDSYSLQYVISILIFILTVILTFIPNIRFRISDEAWLGGEG